jgi:alpha-methylacyl-CoA racemase
MLARGFWTDQRGSNWLDGAAPYYRCYTCKDGKFISVGALEPQFFAELVRHAGLPEADLAQQNDRARWPETADRYAALFATRTRDEWMTAFEGSDACVAPVLSFAEAPAHPVNAERAVFYDKSGVTQAAPAPRFSRSAPDLPAAPGPVGGDTQAILKDLGYDRDAIATLREKGALT